MAIVLIVLVFIALQVAVGRAIYDPLWSDVARVAIGIAMVLVLAWAVRVWPFKRG